MRWLLAFLLCVAFSVAANASCATATPPAIASAQGLTNLVMCDDFADTSTIDVNDTRAKGFHWYTHNAWPQSQYFNCPGCLGGKSAINLPPTLAADYSTGVSGLQLTPRQGTKSGANTNGTNTIALTDTTGIPTTGLIWVTGTGVPAGTTATISGTTATLSNNTSAGGTNTYTFTVVYNGWMLQSAASSASDPGWIGFAPQPPFYIEVSATIPSSGSGHWAPIASYADIWAWPVELFASSHLGMPAVLDYCEFDLNEANGNGASVHTETINGDGNIYYSGNQVGGHTNYTANKISTFGSQITYGLLVTNPSSNSVQAGVGEFNFTESGASRYRVQYGPGFVPKGNGSTTDAGLSPAGPQPAGTYNQCANLHYVIQLDGAADWPGQNITALHVWTLPVGNGRAGAKP